jgi:hypothetical protein
VKPAGRVLLAAALASIVGAGCGGQAPTEGTLPTAVPGTPAAASAGDRTPAPTGSADPSEPSSSTPSAPSASPSGGPGAVEDPSLIEVLPAQVAGSLVTLEPQAFPEAMADPGFATNIEAAAFGIVVAGNDLASAVVARPVDGVFSDAWFRDWRDSYNRGACAQSGGVAGNAEAEMGGLTVYIGTCSGGLRTYHAWIEDRGLLVSAFSIGEARFGEQLMAGLRP